MKRLDSKGLGMVEMCIGMLILTFIAQSVVLSRLVMARKTVSLEDHSYASMKAQQMFNELAALANANPVFGAGILDGYSDGPQYNLVLTADKAVSQPDDPLSGNHQANGHWRYLRQVQVNPADDNPLARQVIVRVWRCASDSNPLVPGLLLTTTVGTVLPGTAPSFAQTPQVYTMPFGPISTQ
ncbi:MAG TPA: hypothetical protein VK859_14015 [bacterium]|jgi:hypothetical protein|nr:hypothetical protein [bacterium]